MRALSWIGLGLVVAGSVAAGTYFGRQVRAERYLRAEVEADLVELVAQNAEMAAALESHEDAEPIVVVRTVTQTIPARAPVQTGDGLRLHVDEVILREGSGHVLVGTASVTNETAGGETIVTGSFDVPIRLPPPPSHWGAGLAALASPSGVAWGLAIAAPPVRVWRLQLEATGVVGAGEHGMQGALMLVGRGR